MAQSRPMRARGCLLVVVAPCQEVPLATLSEGKQLSADQSGAFFLSITNAVALCVEAVDMLFRTAGGPAIYATGPLDAPFATSTVPLNIRWCHCAATR